MGRYMKVKMHYIHTNTLTYSHFIAGGKDFFSKFYYS